MLNIPEYKHYNSESRIEKVNEMRTDERTVTYTKRRKDSSTVLVTQKVDNEQFLELLKDAAVQIIF